MRGVKRPSRQRRSTRFAWPEPRTPATHTSVSTTIFTDAMIAYMQSIGNEKISGVVCPFCAPVQVVSGGFRWRFTLKIPAVFLAFGSHNAEVEGSSPSLTTQ